MKHASGSSQILQICNCAALFIVLTEKVLVNVSLQVRHTAADASPYAGSCSGEGDGGEGAGGGNQRVVLRRQVLSKNPSRSTS